MTWRFQQIKPQKARGVFHSGLWDGHDWIAEKKFDGDRRIAQVCGRKIRYTGCKPGVGGQFVEKTDNLPHINMAPAGWDGTVLDGEMVPPPGTIIEGGESKWVTRVMGASPEVAIRRQEEHGWLWYAVFDCLWFQGRDIRGEPLHVRYNYRRRAVADLQPVLGKYMIEVPNVVGPAKRRLYEAEKEGVVFKRRDHTYGDEKLWVKLKHEFTADVVVLGFEPGKGKYKGQVGAIRFGQYVTPPGNRGARLRPYGTCSGFDDALRLAMTKAPNGFISRVLKIKHKGREPTGAFRHPQFGEWRMDKDPKDCVFDLNET